MKHENISVGVKALKLIKCPFIAKVELLILIVSFSLSWHHYSFNPVFFYRSNSKLSVGLKILIGKAVSHNIPSHVMARAS